MVLSKSFKTKPLKGLSVEVQILDKTGKPHEFCADHDVFAVEPGPFVVDVVVTGAGDMLAQLITKSHGTGEKLKMLITLMVDGHNVARQYMHSGDKAHHKFETQRIGGPDGIMRLYALVFDTPQESKDGGVNIATANSGDTGKIELQFSEVFITQTRVPPSTEYGVEAKAASKGSGRQDKKFFMQQGVAFKTGDCIGTDQQNSSNCSYVRGGLAFAVDSAYDMKAYLQLRGMVPYSDDDEPAAVAPKRRRTEVHAPGKLSSSNQAIESIDLTGE